MKIIFPYIFLFNLILGSKFEKNKIFTFSCHIESGPPFQSLRAANIAEIFELVSSYKQL